MKRIYLLAVLCLPSFSAKAGDFNLDGLNAAAVRAAAGTPVATPRVSGPKDWTVMFYSTTKDKLRYTLMWQLLEMKKTGSTDRVNVVVEASIPVKYADGSVSTSTFRMALGNAGNAAELDKLIENMFNESDGPINAAILAPFAPDMVKTENNTDSGDWHRVADFTKWAKTNYPAKRYVFAIYGHGNGIFDQKKGPQKGTLIDTDTQNYVTLPELRLLMAETGRVDAFVMTSCIMQMAEVAWQIKDYTDVVVGSSELMSAVGYDLKGMLDTLNAEPAITSERLGATLADGYIARIKAFKIPGGHASVILTSKFPAFAGKLNAWVDAELAIKDRAAVTAAGKQVARFDIFGITTATTAVIARTFSISGDLYDFVDIMNAGQSQDTPEQSLARQKGRELMDFISGELIYKYSYTGVSNTGFDYSRAHGLAIHIPPIRVAAASGLFSDFEKNMETIYWDLPFARETRWGEFLSWIYNRKP
ncbi:MAG: clostripain-related cysteine peptidase [Elusimicrobia bacterium]|nr:clostripain-related cysteine peptidase [Elusimicrobiota bacterium]